MQFHFLNAINKIIRLGDLLVKKVNAKWLREIVRKSCFVFLLLFFFQQTFSQSINTKILDSLFNILDSNHLAMGSVAIAKDGKVVYQRQISYAYLDGNKKIPANANTKYRIGSITKMFTAVIIFQLIEKKELSLDTKLAKFYPQIPNADKITIDMLLRHRSGLYDYINDSLASLIDYLHNVKHDYDDIDCMKEASSWLIKPLKDEDILKIIEKGKTHFFPDSNALYCNSGYWLLGKIIEDITKKSYKENVEQRIIDKIHLENTFVDNVPKNKGLLADGYYYCDGWNKIEDFYLNNGKGAGDILSTPRDLITFLQAIFSYNLVSKKSLAEMCPMKDSVNIDDESLKGFQSFNLNGYLGVGHLGGTLGTNSMDFYYKKQNIVIAYALNTSDGNDILETDLILACMQDSTYALPTFYSYVKSTKELNPYLGVYSSKQISLKFTFTKACTTLTLQATGQNAFKTKSVAKNKFTIDDIHASMEFFPEKEELIYKQNGKTYLFTKDQ